ncbi:MAG TPA: complex I subunit 5 family protein [Geminicoccaceae bacterium]|nr:complex I subunit 5 family protein [Geminicoccaceae bacterium]
MTPLAALALIAVPGLPLALAGALAVPPLRRSALALAPWAALPALLVAAAGWPVEPLRLPWLLLGTELGLDTTRRVFLLLTGGLWLAAGLSAAAYHRDDPRKVRLFAFHLVTLAGNLGLVVALDAASFYLFFITMSLAAFGLVVHVDTAEARRAGLVYLALVILGEALILPGLWLAAAAAPSLRLADVAAAVAQQGPGVVLLLAAGFGVKAGVLPLHVWLPLAHPVAPTPASAVLSGSMIKAGLLAWLVFLPFGGGASPGFAALFIVLGLAAAFYGAAVGVLQSRPKTVLAYSSISQMGLITVAAGIGFTHPDIWPLAATAVLAYALHHALAKGALFLGVAVVENAADAATRRRALLLLLLPALALAGAPLTSGIVAKTILKEAAYRLEPAWRDPVDLLLPLAAVGTTLLMARFLWLMTQTGSHGARPGLWPSWLGLLLAVALVSWLPIVAEPEIVALGFAPGALGGGTWPLALGILAAALVLWLRRSGRALPRPAVPEGDLLWPVVRLGRAVWRQRPAQLPERLARGRASLGARLERAEAGAVRLLARGERALAAWPAVAGTVLATLLVLVLVLAMG